MPASLPSFTISAIFAASWSGFTWYGSSVTTRQVRPWISSTLTTARMMIEPRPVRYASAMPRVPRIVAPVGKSGPLIRCVTAAASSSGPASGFASAQRAASATSRRLCGGIFVAMPTAMPSEPFASSAGNRAGSTTGSCVRPS